MRRLIALRKGRRHPNHGNTLLPTPQQLDRILREQTESPQSLHVKVGMYRIVFLRYLFTVLFMFIVLQYLKCYPFVKGTPLTFSVNLSLCRSKRTTIIFP